MADTDDSAALSFALATILGTCFVLCLSAMAWVVCRARSDRRRCGACCPGEEPETPPPAYRETRPVMLPLASTGRERPPRPRPPGDEENEEEVQEEVQEENSATSALDAGAVKIKTGRDYAPSWQDFGDVLAEEEEGEEDRRRKHEHERRPAATAPA